MSGGGSVAEEVEEQKNKKVYEELKEGREDNKEVVQEEVAREGE